MTALDSHLALRALADEFVRCGIEHACTSPGSRNTPLLLTLASDRRLQVWSHVDERAAGFFAVGVARASGQPAAVTCTSGTAAANLLPAIVEAHEAGLPMIVLTADRPPELRDVGAGQTIDQTKLYGDAVKWFFDLGVPEATPDRLRWLRSLACRAYLTATEGRPGVVHLNVPLREPLALDQPLPSDEPGGGGRPDGRPWVSQVSELGSRPVDGIREPHPFAQPTVFVAGDLGPDPKTGATLARFAERAGVPLLADPRSGARRGTASISHYDLLLRDEATATALAPEVVCRIGDLPTSKPLRIWIEGLSNADHVSFSADGRWSDPSSRITYRSIGSLSALLERVDSDEVEPADPGWLRAWRAADDAVASAVAGSLVESGLSEPAVAATLGDALPPEASLVVAASMPIRDVEGFFGTRTEPPRVIANRGANGIDGTIATAFGVAAASAGPVVLLIGDVALAHDLGALLTAMRTHLRLTIVLINNGGGGIFDFLPIAAAAEPELFESQLATPTQLDFERVAGLFGCRYRRPEDTAVFRSAVEDSLRADTTTLIEVRGDRGANLTLHRELEATALAALRSGGSLPLSPRGAGATPAA